MIISTTGLIGSGKDTVADFLTTQYGFKRLSFAASLKDAIAVIFGWDREMLEGRTKAAREMREQVDQWWADRLDMPLLSPRWVLQNFGTDVCRKYFHDDIWLAALENKLRKNTDNIVITDARFPNELKMIKELDGQCWCVERGELPAWYEYAKQYNNSTEETQMTLRIIADVQPTPNIFNKRIHQSEWKWIGFHFDNVIDNDGTIDELYTAIQSIVDR